MIDTNEYASRLQKHTPGPWRVYECGFYGADITTSYDVDRAEGDASPELVASAYHMRRAPRQHEANARLIAAAPDMLEALKTIENDAEQVPEWLWNRIQALIAQVEGR